MRPRALARPTLAALAGAVLACTRLAAQELVLHGRIADARGRPRPGLEVALHRVTPAGGALVARDTTGPDGRFTFPIPDDDGQAVYFAATRTADGLFVGPAFRPPALPPDYTIRLAPEAALQPPAGEPPRPASPPPPPNPYAGRAPARPLALALPALLAALAAATIRARANGRRHRALFLEIARLDEEHATTADPVAREAYLHRRAALLTRLRRQSPRQPPGPAR